MQYYDDGPMYTMPRDHHKMVFDGKRHRKQVARRTVDYNASVIAHVETRSFQRDYRDIPALQPEQAYSRMLLPTNAYEDNFATSITTRYQHTSTNKNRCPINVVCWTPEGRRLLTGASSGEFTLWNGLMFNFETILQAHDTAVRAMVWSHNENWLVTADNGGVIKYWQSNMNNLKAWQGHKEAIRNICFSPTDLKFATCSDDVSIKIWDFARCQDEKTLTGHGWDVKCLSWHPFKPLVVSGSKDNLVKIWDAKGGKNIATLHGHKSTVLSVKCNKNGNWVLSASRDQTIKLFDLRMMKEMRTYRGHKREVTCLSWHPFHEDFFVSGGWDGSLFFWSVDQNDPQADIPNAHESSVWDLAWHPLGHVLCSGSNDHTTKFWVRQRPGDIMKDKYSQMQTAAATSVPEYDVLDNRLPPGLAHSAMQHGQQHQTQYHSKLPGGGPPRMHSQYGGHGPGAGHMGPPFAPPPPQMAYGASPGFLPGLTPLPPGLAPPGMAPPPYPR